MNFKHKLLFICLLFLSTGIFSQQRFTFSGIVADSISGTALNKVDVVINQLHVGTITDSQGFYSLQLPSGQYEIVFSFSNYVTQSIKVNIQNDQSYNVGLLAKNAQAENRSEKNRSKNLIVAFQSQKVEPVTNGDSLQK